LEYNIYSLEGMLEQNHVNALRKLMRKQEAEDKANQKAKKQKKKEKKGDQPEDTVDTEIQWAYQCYCTRNNDRYFFPYHSDPEVCTRIAETLDK
jgi:sRNA-binding protein